MKKRYRATTGLNYPTSPSVIKRLLAGEDIPVEQRHETRIEAGEICDPAPPRESVPHLLAAGLITEEDADGDPGI
jgi:hypothetical protein